jgi:ABC-type nitrate/sulfonate/bicarbonate transport system substrate-binding protein
MTRRGLLAGAGAITLAAPMLAPRLARAATPASFQLDWKINAQFAGLLVADADGLYAANETALEIRPWADGVNVVMDVAEGRADFACAEQNLIIAAQAEGAPIRAVASMFQASPYGLMAPAGAGLTALDVLRGKKVGVHVDGVKVMALVKGVTGIEDIEVVEIDYANKFDRAVSGEFAAVQCYVIDEPIGVAARTGAEPEVLKLSDYGFVSTAQTIVVSEATLAERPDLVRGVLAATFDGWTRALADKAGTAAVIVDRYVEEGSAYKDVAYQTRTLELLEPYVTGMGPMGVIDPVKWREASELMAAYGIVAALPDLEASLAPGFFG